MSSVCNDFLLMTWNAQGQSNMPSIAKYVAEFQKQAPNMPYIVCLQEVSVGNKDNGVPTLSLNRDTLFGRGTDKDDSGNQRCNTAIFSCKEISIEGRYTSFHSNRYYETIKLKYASNDFWVQSVHMPSSASTNAADLGASIKKEVLERAPIIMVGDMNCDPSCRVPFDHKRV